MTNNDNEKSLIKLQAFEKKLGDQILSLRAVNENLQENNQQVLAQCSVLQDLAGDIQKQMKQSLDHACESFAVNVADRFENIYQDKIDSLTKKLDATVTNTQRAMTNSQLAIEGAAKKLSYKRYMFMAGFCIASLMTGVATHYLLTWCSPPASSLTEHQRSDIIYGKSLKIIWPQLSKKEQARMIKLLEVHNSKSSK